MVSFVRPLEAINSTAVRMTWELRGKTRNIDGFRIRYRVSPDLDQAAGDSLPAAVDSFLEETVHDGRSTSHVIGGLSRYTYYEFRIQPVIQGATGLESTPVTVRTLEDGKLQIYLRKLSIIFVTSRYNFKSCSYLPYILEISGGGSCI